MLVGNTEGAEDTDTGILGLTAREQQDVEVERGYLDLRLRWNHC